MAKGWAMETAAPWKPWKNELHVFPPFPPRLENSAKKQLRRVFHSSHSPYCYLFSEEKNRTHAAVLVQLCMDKKESEA